MARYLISLMFMWFAIGAIVVVEAYDPTVGPGYAFEFAGAIDVALVPVAAAWLAAELAGLRRKRTWLLPHAGWLRPLGLGLCAGVSGVALAAGLLLIAPDAWPDGVLIASAAAAASFASVWLAPVERSGWCPLCGYDRSAATPTSRGVCPECGHDAFALE